MYAWSVGKTTFTKLLTGELEPNHGDVVIGETVVLGVYDQLGLKFDEIAEKQTVLEYVVDQIQSNDGSSMGETPNEARDLLRQFEFPTSRWQERISVLSGGERRRLQILSVLSVVSCQINDEKKKTSGHSIQSYLYILRSEYQINSLSLRTSSSSSLFIPTRNQTS